MLLVPRHTLIAADPAVVGRQSGEHPVPVGPAQRNVVNHRAVGPQALAGDCVPCWHARAQAGHVRRAPAIEPYEHHLVCRCERAELGGAQGKARVACLLERVLVVLAHWAESCRGGSGDHGQGACETKVHGATAGWTWPSWRHAGVVSCRVGSWVVNSGPSVTSDGGPSVTRRRACMHRTTPLLTFLAPDLYPRVSLGAVFMAASCLGHGTMVSPEPVCGRSRIVGCQPKLQSAWPGCCAVECQHQRCGLWRRCVLCMPVPVPCACCKFT